MKQTGLALFLRSKLCNIRVYSLFKVVTAPQVWQALCQGSNALKEQLHCMVGHMHAALFHRLGVAASSPQMHSTGIKLLSRLAVMLTVLCLMTLAGMGFKLWVAVLLRSAHVWVAMHRL